MSAKKLAEQQRQAYLNKIREDHEKLLIGDYKNLVKVKLDKLKKEEIELKLRAASKLRYIEQLQDSDSVNAKPGLGYCGQTALMQHLGTCWFNSVINMFLLDDILSAMVIDSMYASSYNVTQVAYPEPIPHLEATFQRIYVNTCPKEDFYETQAADVIYALFHHVYVTAQAVAVGKHGDSASKMIASMLPFITQRPGMTLSKDVLYEVANNKRPTEDTNVIQNEFVHESISHDSFVSISYHLCEIFQIPFAAFDDIGIVASNASRENVSVLVFYNILSSNDVKPESIEGFMFRACTIRVSYTKKGPKHVIAGFFCNGQFYVYDSNFAKPVQVDIQQLKQGATIKLESYTIAFVCFLQLIYVRNDVVDQYSNMHLKLERLNIQLRQTRQKIHEVQQKIEGIQADAVNTSRRFYQ